MMRSMFSGVSSLRVHQTRMDVIANNIANVNTDGFKASRATFQDAFYQNLQGATGPDPTFGRAGRNPQQVGLGLSLASIDNLMHQGIARRTDNALDVAIEGGGFFITRDRGGANLFTRTGRIERDAHWNLHISGNSLMGWSTIPCQETPGGWAVDRGLLQPLSLSGEKQNMPSEPTTRINFTGNLNRSQLSVTQRPAGAPFDPPGATTVDMRYTITPKTIYDSLGNRYTMNIRFTYHPHTSGAAGSPHGYWTMEAMGGYYTQNAAGEWEEASAGDTGAVRLVHAFRDDDRRREDPSLISICFMGPDRGGATGNTPIMDFASDAHASATIAFNSVGDVIGIGHVADDYIPGQWPEPTAFLQGDRDSSWWGGRNFNMSIIPVRGVAPSATFGETTGTSSYMPDDTVQIAIGALTINFTELGQRGQANTSITALTWDGGGPGTLMDINVGQDGTIMGRYSNGRDRILGQIPLAFFTNPAGLDRAGASFWRETANSGPFDGAGQIGAMIGGALEGSNVDLANEFTDMITTQRGFQAASRTITVSDEMLQELVNLRR
ncbi:MAG: flagellar hook protein FlgE [Defluviitaleaceae bacterium]|nr:flagellar hook protein FlgE [Defluviitaleaceae bacterium]MCL2261769.1 flagellar hook protein FlgE [Defluviitaleaceae bacterium]